jgi:hypothetical protein
MTVFTFSLLPFVYAFLLWFFALSNTDFVLSHYLWFLLASHGFLTCFYLFLRKRDAPVFGARLGMLVFFLAPIVTPSLLQTDQLRYIWDGLHLSQGVNPYRFSPQSIIDTMPQGVNLVLETGTQVPIPWARHINHPGMHTVYPPLAEILFAVSTHLNPFFSSSGVRYGLSWAQQVLPHFVFWPWELGLRVLVGVALAGTVFVLKSHRWDLFLFHPLVFLTAIANIHVDALMLPLLALVFFPNKLSRSAPHGVAVSMAFLVRWLPGLFIPTALVQTFRRDGWRAMILLLMSSASLCGVILFYFWKGSDGNMLSSPKAYAEHWYFFGFMHRFVMDLLEVSGAAGHRAQLAKAILSVPFALAAAWVLVMQWRGRLSFSLASLLILLAFFVVAPTLHPWYLLTLLLVGFRHQRPCRVVWIWPLMAPLSYVYYFNMTDVPWVRASVYLIISVLLVCDLRLILRHVNRPAFNNLV